MRHTGGSSGVSADVHDRMPAWLAPAQIDAWLYAEPDEAMQLLLTSDVPTMQTYRVSRAVNTPRNNVASLLQPTVQAFRQPVSLQP